MHAGGQEFESPILHGVLPHIIIGSVITMFENNTTIALFPSALMASSYHSSFEEELNYIKGLEYGGEGPGEYVEQTLDTFVLDHPQLSNIRKFIESKIDSYLSEVMCTDSKLRITQSWVNKLPKGKQHSFHFHPNSILSGVFYLVSNRDHPQILFKSVNRRDFSFPPKKVNQYNSHTFMLPTQSGDLIVFPSNLYHTVVPNASDTPRMSISFNTWPDSPIGDIDDLTLVP